MKFFFIHDYKNKYRYFSTEPVKQIQVNFSRLRKIWEEAKKKLMLLPQRVLRQEQAFTRTPIAEENKITIFHSDRLSQRKVKMKFRFFLRKQKTTHLFFLIGETLLLPFSGLAGLLPGPNVFFGVLILMMITQWQALKGINRLLKKEYEFIPSSLFSQWEETLKGKREGDFPLILEKIEKKFNVPNIKKILWK